MKSFQVLFSALLCCLMSDTLSADDAGMTALSISTTPTERGFDISGSFYVPLTPCQSYHLLTDYELEQELPGVTMIKHTRLSNHRVSLQRELEERILFLPVKISSVIEITERPYRGMDFVQVRGSAKSYAGQWRLQPLGQGTQFIYKAHTEPGTIFPDAVARQVVEESLRRNFAAMVDVAHRRINNFNNQCT